MSNKIVRPHDTLKTMRQVSLPEVLKRARGPKRSLREMARETGLAVSAIKCLEDGATAVPKRETVPLLSAAYGVDEDVIVRAAYGLYFEEESVSPHDPAAQDAALAHAG